jgi:AAA+ superfamily predicted ATPase
MHTLYLKSGSKFTATTKDALDIYDRLPQGTYSIKQTPTGEYYLERIQNLTLPTKLYGTTTRKAERIFNTFLKRPSTTGILLAGTKGSGKTMLAKQVSRMAAASAENIPTVVIKTSPCVANLSMNLFSPLNSRW